MLNIHQRSVNVSRKQLLECLYENLEVHKREFAEAQTEFKERLLADLKKATEKVEGMTPEKLATFRFTFQYPQSHVAEYEGIIEMLEMSVDENINLDSESFKAYVKNEWSWSRGFEATKMLYKSGSFIA